MDTGIGTGRLTLATLAAVATFDTDMHRDRQLQGIAATPRGRKVVVRRDAGQIREIYAAGAGGSDIAAQPGTGSASVYRLLTEACDQRACV